MNNFRLLSVGDRFPAGLFDLIHSRFKRVLNFTHADRIISLVSPDIGAGPFQIVVSELNTDFVQVLKHKPGSIVINDKEEISYPETQIYQSGFTIYHPEPALLQKNLSLLKDMVVRSYRESPLVFLLTGKAYTASSAFDRGLRNRFAKAYEVLCRGSFADAVGKFKGRGWGLTPSGDDFNAGLLIGLYIRQLSEKKELSNIRSCIYHNSLGTNLQVNTYLLQAWRGWFSERWKNLLAAIVERPDKIEQAGEAILRQGETSGADSLAGFLAAWELTV